MGAPKPGEHKNLVLFFSYGRTEDIGPRVTRIHNDLTSRGHRVWFDQRQLPVGKQWRREIMDGISESSEVVAFLSKHSVASDACAGELRIALAVKGCHIQTVLMESEQDVSPPPLLAEVQWLDLHEWGEVEQKGAQAFDDWYAPRLAELISAIESDEHVAFAGEIDQLRRILRPALLDQKERALLASAFVGREWLAEQLEDWRKNQPHLRAFVLLGTPGAGKSAFAVNTLFPASQVFNPHAVCGILVEYDKRATSDPKHVICTLAFKLAAKLSDYRRTLLETLTDARSVDDATARELFERLITHPLSCCIPRPVSERMFVVLDALDEASGGGQLAEVLADGLKMLPQWLGVCVTARPEEELERLFRDKGFDPVVVDTDNPRNLTDLRDYLDLNLPSLSAERLDAAVSGANGSFQHAKLIGEHLAAGGSPDDLPTGLHGLYQQWFDRALPVGDQPSLCWATARQFLEVILADQALPETALRDVVGDDYAYLDFRKAMGSLLVEGDGVLHFCHKSVADWLSDWTRNKRHYVDAKRGHARLVHYTTRSQVDVSARVGAPAWEYLHRQLSAHFCGAGQWHEYAAALASDAPDQDLLRSAEDFGPLWHHVGCFPESWDTDAVFQPVQAAYQQATGRLSHATYSYLDGWEAALRVFRHAVPTRVLARHLFEMLSGPFRIDRFLRSGASEEGMVPPDKDMIACHLAGALKRLSDAGIPIPDGIQSLSARVALAAGSSIYWHLRRTPSQTLNRHPEMFSYGVLPNDPESAEFNVCAAAYELVFAGKPDPGRLHQILASGASRVNIANLVITLDRPRVLLCGRTVHIVALENDFNVSARLAGAVPLCASADSVSDADRVRNAVAAAHAMVVLVPHSATAVSSAHEIAALAEGKPMLELVAADNPLRCEGQNVFRYANYGEAEQLLQQHLPRLVAATKPERLAQVEARLHERF